MDDVARALCLSIERLRAHALECLTHTTCSETPKSDMQRYAIDAGGGQPFAAQHCKVIRVSIRLAVLEKHRYTNGLICRRLP